jgi:multidrug efflux pump subunit AcrA (membrane-fusion protein)
MSRGAILILAAAMALTACGRSDPPTTHAVQAPPGRLVVEERQAPDYKTVSAVLTNRDVGDARARIGGTLSRLLVREGDTVRRGQLVALISDQRLALEAQGGAAGVVAAEALAGRARADLGRYQALFDRGLTRCAQTHAPPKRNCRRRVRNAAHFRKLMRKAAYWRLLTDASPARQFLKARS